MTGLISIVLGIALVGLSASGGETKALGIIILLVGQIFGATGYIIEEKYLGEFDNMDPYLMAGIEGVWGTLMWLIILPILQFIPCTPTTGVCTRYGTMEDSLAVFHEYACNPMYILMSFVIVFAMPLLYGAALNITKYGSAAARTTVETGRNVMIWGFFLFIPVYGVLIEKFSWL
jgi:hypothetical protein